MTALLALIMAVSGATAIGLALVAVVTLPHRTGTYRRDHATAGPLLDRTEPWA